MSVFLSSKILDPWGRKWNPVGNISFFVQSNERLSFPLEIIYFCIPRFQIRTVAKRRRGLPLPPPFENLNESTLKPNPLRYNHNP